MILPIALVLLVACDPSRPTHHHPDAGSGACPDPFQGRAELTIDASCLAGPCKVAVERSGCTFTLTLSVCEDAEIRGTIAESGAIDQLSSDAFGTCASGPPRSEALAAIACASSERSCRFDLYAPPPPLAGEVTTYAIEQVDFMSPRGSVALLLDENDALKGYAPSFVLLDGAIAVIAGDTFTNDCSEDLATAIYLIDPDRMTRTSSRSGPPCLNHLLRDPLGSGFLGVYGTSSTAIARFDAAGRVLATWPLVQPDLEEPRYAVAMTSTAGFVQILLSSRHNKPGSAYLFVVDVATLKTIAVSPRVAGRFRGGALSDQLRFISGDFVNSRFHTWDAMSAAVEDGLTLISSRKVSSHAGFIGYDPLNQRALIATTGDMPALWTLPDGAGSAQVLDTAIFYESPAGPWAMVQDPARSGLQIVALTGLSPDYDAQLARFSPAEGRFLPGAIAIGRGLVSALATDREGRIFGLLPWSGTVVRVSNLSP